MTRANTEQIKYTPWFAKAGAACSIVPISRFIGPNIFALKGGGYGCLFALSGIDEEGLTDQELDSRMRSIEGALRGLPEGSCLYQYTRVMSGFELPSQKKYSNPVTQVFVDDRLHFLEKTAGFRRIDLHWCLAIEPSQLKAFERKPQENAADTSRILADLQKAATILEGHLGGLLVLRLLDKNSAFQFFSYLFNLEEWASQAQLRDDTGVDRQIVSNPVAWHSDHLRVGKRYVQMYSLKTTPEASRPCLFSALLTLDCDSVLCSTWRPKSIAAIDSKKPNTKQELITANIKLLIEQLEAGKSDALTNYLTAMSRFHNYSFGNVLEIARQMPTATRVAGFWTWKNLGRSVKAGQKGIRILAPIVGVRRKRDEEAEKDITKQNTRVVLGFRNAYVFDVSQTDGVDLPELHEVTGDPGENIDRLAAFLKAQGIQLVYNEKIAPALGMSYGGRIAILPGQSKAEEFSTLVHETAHELLHKAERRTATTKTVRETEAEAVAFVVGKAVGLVAGTASADYIQLYHGNASLLAESLEVIQQTSGVILAALESPVETEATTDAELAEVAA